jgi:endonuclease YncB( thermonuclease family)
MASGLKGVFIMRFSSLATLVLVTSFLLAGAASAQNPTPVQAAADAAASALPERIIRPMQPVDPVTLRAEGVSIRLWGIKTAETAETPLELKALDMLDDLTSAQMVNCKIVGGAVPELWGQCQNQANQDLALTLLEKGVVVVDRRQTYNTVMATGYAKAQESARLKGLGVWKFMNEGANDAPPVPKWLQPHMSMLLPVALLFGPVGGLLIVALVMHLGLRRLGARQEGEHEDSQRKEAALQSRERQILVTTLEGELTDNKNKLSAFLAIYGDMLDTLKKPGETHKYQSAGDIVQKHPAFSKTVFEASVSKLSLLDVKTAGLVSKLYGTLAKEPEYVNLDPGVPLDTAVKLLEKILGEAQALQPGIDQAITALQTAGQKAE